MRYINATIDEYSNIEALLKLPALSKIDLMGNLIYSNVTEAGNPSRKVMEALRTRGVKIRIVYASHDMYPGGRLPKAFE